jgi:hypothetical protein
VRRLPGEVGVVADDERSMVHYVLAPERRCDSLGLLAGSDGVALSFMLSATLT